MANYFHGVSTRQNDTSISTPVTADSGIAFVVGAAPGHTVGGAPNDPIMCQSYAEAVAALGYSDDWRNTQSAKLSIRSSSCTAWPLWCS